MGCRFIRRQGRIEGESLCSGEVGCLWIYTDDRDGLEGLGGLYILVYIGWILECTNGIASLDTYSSSQNVGVPSEPVINSDVKAQRCNCMAQCCLTWLDSLISYKLLNPPQLLYYPVPYKTRHRFSREPLDRDDPIVPNTLPISIVRVAMLNSKPTTFFPLSLLLPPPYYPADYSSLLET